MTKNKNFWLGIGIAFIGIIIFKTFSFISNKKADTSSSESSLTLWDLGYIPTKPAQSVEDFDLMMIKQDAKTDTSPEAVKFSSFKGKPIVLHFWATWCGPCLIELPDYNRFAKNQKIVNIAVCVDKSPPEKIRQFCLEKGLQNLQVALDSNSILSRRFHADGLPTSVFINNKGQEIGRITGPVEWHHPETVKLIENYLLSN